jgi:CspA family cold shock protein
MSKEKLRERGRVVSFKSDRGFGFIQPDGGGDDIFFHINQVPAGSLGVGEAVEYLVGIDQRRGKPRAENVRVIG